MDISQNSMNISKVMTQITSLKIPIQNDVQVFLFPINSNEFDYRVAAESLLESIADFALSRQTKEYSGTPNYMKLSREARDKFKDWKQNTGELGEFLLFCFLEGHLGAPKILSKLELKTSKEMYVHGADGLHFLKLQNGNYQLIFGESKLRKLISASLREAFKSIKDFKDSVNPKGNEKSGISFERSLMSSNLARETFSDEEKSFISNIIYPKPGESNFTVDDAFGIFVGYEVNYNNERKTLSNDDFRKHVETNVKEVIEKQKANIERYIEEFDLYGHSFYIYVLPFSKLDETREMMLKELLR